MQYVVAHASDEGNYAREAASAANGFFTGALLRHIRNSGHSVPLMGLLSFVSEDVMQATGARQRPTPVGTVGSDVFLVDLYGSRRLPGPNPEGVALGSAVGPLCDSFKEQVSLEPTLCPLARVC
jgi:hypothetical protein